MRKAAGILAMSISMMANASTVQGQRYCEIVYSKDYMDFYVYSTYTVNHCPALWWKTLNQKVLTKHLGASYVFLNGPRLWVADEISNFKSSKNQMINGANLPQVASFHSSLQSLLKRHGPFVDYEVERSQIYHFHKGSKIYELINPKGQVYILHSISLKHRNQTISQLDSLAKQLKLPQGWSFKSGQLNTEFKLFPQNQTIHVVMDEFDNTYQLTPKDPLKS